MHCDKLGLRVSEQSHNATWLPFHSLLNAHCALPAWQYSPSVLPPTAALLPNEVCYLLFRSLEDSYFQAPGHRRAFIVAACLRTLPVVAVRFNFGTIELSVT